MQKMPEQFDYIFTGGGMAAASLLLRMLKQPELQEKRILIADPKAFAGMEKTWCFWEEGEGFFEDLKEKSWNKAWFHAPGFSKELNLKPFRYKMLRSEALFMHALQQTEDRPGIRIIHESVAGFGRENGKIQVNLSSGEKVEAGIVFNSIPPLTEKKPDHFYLLQHFRGWFIRTRKPLFDTESATLMDFRISQEGDCRFVYILPYAPDRALVEYTVFSESLLKDEEYEKHLSAYLQGLAPDGFDILQKEAGVIPMYSAPFPESGIPGIINIGTKGGMTKASTGYTFMKVQKHSDAIVAGLLAGKVPDNQTFRTSPRFSWYDRVLLRILAQKSMAGRDIFKALFQKNPPETVLRFLQEESGFAEELRIMRSVPALKFMMPGLLELFRKD